MSIEEQYQNTLDYLFSFVDYSLTKQLVYSPEKFNLDRMTRLLDLMGNPQKAYPIVHVTGTKGKGSVASLCSSVLKESGFKVGLYTSPHLIDYNERIQVNLLPIPHADMVTLVDRLMPMIDRVKEITTFEISTAMAFQYFKDQHVDYAVIEVGLGGRLDATNVVDPVLSVITTISYDHQAILGNSIAEIAAEKAGIIKPGKPVVLASQTSEALQVLLKKAEENGSMVTLVGKDMLYTAIRHDLDSQSLFVWSIDDQEKMNRFIEGDPGNKWKPNQFTIPLLGAHQLENATTAYSALKILQKQDPKITDIAIVLGFKNVSWPCRFEVISKKPLIILDSAHNRDSAIKLRLTLDDYLPGNDVLLIFGASEDKDVRGMLVDLLPRVSQVIATQSIHPRALDAGVIVDFAHLMGKKVKAILPLEDAFQEAFRLANGERAILVAGSIFIAAAVKELWINQQGNLQTNRNR
jgi:dihydrofolate synthase/folylpolyglutamate synthase